MWGGKTMIKLILCKPEKVETNFIKTIKGLKNNVVAVLVTRPYSSFESVFKKSCKQKSCFFIDTLMEYSSLFSYLCDHCTK